MSSRLEILIDFVVQKFIYKNRLITLLSRFTFIPKTGRGRPKTGFFFTVKPRRRRSGALVEPLYGCQQTFNVKKYLLFIFIFLQREKTVQRHMVSFLQMKRYLGWVRSCSCHSRFFTESLPFQDPEESTESDRLRQNKTLSSDINAK